MRRAAVMAAAAATVAVTLGAAPARAETFTSKQFLQWPQASQVSYFQASIGMAAAIASQRGDGLGRCVSEWYFGNPDSRHAVLRDTMRKNSGYHPQAVILAILQKACGKFD